MVMPGYRTAHLDELEAVPWAGDMTWHPVRGQLGIRAFGAAAFTAAETGEPVVEPHSESEDGRGHEELYYVARGRATFTLDGETLDAPAGTFVFVGDPAVHRRAVAAEPETAVLAFGGEPTFTPAGDEYIARVQARLGDPDAARTLAEEGLRELPESPGVRYALALAAAARGDEAEARRRLAEAVERVPELAAEARRNPVLAGLLG
jgi:mannose-6-phosphate isomerase-like protein (cupin superfamily)